MNEKHLPQNGEFRPAKNRLFKETIIFVPFFGGTPLQLQTHVKLVNQLGFDAVTFDLSYHEKWILDQLPISRETGKIGLKHLWADEIERVLHAVLGPKIIFGFSNPCSAALAAMIRTPQRFGRTQNTRDIRGMICDSGPFVHMLECSWRLWKYDRGFRFLPINGPLAILTTALWDPRHNHELSVALDALPEQFPLLSIRGWKDKLVPLKAIEDVFKNHEKLNLEVLGLPEADHLKGLRDCRPEYEPRVSQFLKRIATPLHTASDATAGEV